MDAKCQPIASTPQHKKEITLRDTHLIMEKFLSGKTQCLLIGWLVVLEQRTEGHFSS